MLVILQYILNSELVWQIKIEIEFKQKPACTQKVN